jgi:hypothetical protein
MSTIIASENKKSMGTIGPTTSKSITNWKKIVPMTFAGGLAFWLTNFAISRTSLAAEYREALSISYLPMLVEALVGGLVIGFCVSFFLIRFNNTIPAKNQIVKSLMLSFLLIAIITVTIGNPSSFMRSGNIPRYFTIGTLINLTRISSLGLTIGVMAEKANLHIS